MDATEQRVKHLEMIQAVISRLAHNSFLVKGWSVAIGAALFGLAVHNDEWQFSAIGCGAVLLLWLLDAYYLRTEKLFRGLHDLVRTEDPRVGPFSMDYTVAGRNDMCRVLATMFTTTQILLHGAIFGAGLLVTATLKTSG